MLMYFTMIDSPPNQSKFEKIYLTYRNLMYRAAYSILKNEADAEDAVHNAFVKIAENISMEPLNKWPLFCFSSECQLF